MTDYERSTLHLAKVAAWVSGVAVVFVGLQWWVMREQLNEIRSGSKDTHILADAAKKQADKAETISASIQQAVSEIKTTNSQSKRALDAAIANFRLDQRAWVGVGEVVKPDFKVGSKVTFGATFMNSGKTPARKLKARMHLELVPRDQKPTPVYSTTMISISVLHPGSCNNLRALSNEAITQTLIDELRNGSQIIYIFGEITYEDIFSRPHYTTFCMHTQENLEAAPINCDYYNNAN